MTGLLVGDQPVKAIYAGDRPVTAIYVGSEQIWSAAPSAGYSFTITAGEFMAGVVGYGRDGAFGNIDNEPVPGQTLEAAFTQTDGVNASLTIGFEGDIASLLSGLGVWVDGTPYGAGDVSWAYDDGNDVTVWFKLAGVSAFEPDEAYLVEIK